MAPELVSRQTSRNYACTQPSLTKLDTEPARLYTLPLSIPDGSVEGRTEYVRDIDETTRRYGEALGDAGTIWRRVISPGRWFRLYEDTARPALRAHGARGKYGSNFEYLRHIGMLPTHLASAQNQPAIGEPGQPDAAEGSQAVPTQVK